jgi:transposase-like protein
MKPFASLGPTIQSRPDCCPSCDSRRIIKRGLRDNRLRQLQIYWCKDCGHYFASLMGLKGVRYPPRVIMRALCLYNLGFTQHEAARCILAEHHIRVPRRTVSNWITGFRPITTFHRLRPAAVQACGRDMLRDRILEHRQEYHYQVHLAKLALVRDAMPFGVAPKVEEYLLSIFDNFPHHLFRDDGTGPGPDNQDAVSGQGQTQSSAPRSSQSDFETLPFARIRKENLANDLAALGLLLARKNKDRHPSVQDFMLANDSCTVACEVPVYLTPEEVGYYRSQGFFVALPELEKPITGHIDLVQMRNGLIHLLDYKPDARSIDPVNQLLVYALAFASRTRLPLRRIQCGWFDDRDYYSFYPLQAVRAKAA